MDLKVLRTLIYVFSGLLVLFCLLILVNYVGSISGSSRGLPGQEAAEEKIQDPAAMAEQALAAARYSGGARASMIPASRQGLSTGAVNSAGAIMLVKDDNFSGVAEAPQDMMDLLSTLSGGDKKKPSPIAMKESDLDKKIMNVGGAPPAEASLKASAIPEMGRGAAQEGLTLFTAPVDYKIFKSSGTWWAFANSHKCRSVSETGPESGSTASPLTAPDFSREAVVVLVSVSELPNGIFRIIKYEKAGKALLISYKVDPMAMAAGGEDSRHDFYSAAVIPKSAAVKLIQVP